MHLAIFIVCQGVLLQTKVHQFIGDHDGIPGISRISGALSLHHQLQNIQQLSRIATAETQDGARFLQLDFLLFQNHIRMDGAIEQLQQIIFLQRLQHIKLTT